MTVVRSALYRGVYRRAANLLDAMDSMLDALNGAEGRAERYRRALFQILGDQKGERPGHASERPANQQVETGERPRQ